MCIFLHIYIVHTNIYEQLKTLRRVSVVFQPGPDLGAQWVHVEDQCLEITHRTGGPFFPVMFGSEKVGWFGWTTWFWDLDLFVRFGFVYGCLKNISFKRSVYWIVVTAGQHPGRSELIALLQETAFLETTLQRAPTVEEKWVDNSISVGVLFRWSGSHQPFWTLVVSVCHDLLSSGILLIGPHQCFLLICLWCSGCGSDRILVHGQGQH